MEANLDAYVRDLGKSITDAENEIGSVRVEFDYLITEIDSAVAEIGKIEEANSDLQSEVNDLKKTIDKMNEGV